MQPSSCGSKSLTNRALILAALASNPVVLRSAHWSEDTQAMVNSLKRLGFCIEVADEPAEPANCTLTVYGCGGKIPNAGAAAQALRREMPARLSASCRRSCVSAKALTA
jgi:3-phosphoshikimate 1-carboxyvinyltransferase